MSKIELGLHEHHASYQASNPSPASGPSQGAMRGGSAGTEQGLVDTPFAKVNSVVPGSPADDAGLKAGDRIRKFGDVNWLNHDKLSKVAETVQRNQGVSLFALPLLLEALADLVLRPAKRGCEGCSKHRRIDIATDSEEQLGRTGPAGLPSSSSLTFCLGHNCVPKKTPKTKNKTKQTLEYVECRRSLERLRCPTY